MQHLLNDAVVSERVGSRSNNNPLARLDRWLGGLGMGAAVAVLTGAAAVLAVAAASGIWLVAYGAVPVAIPTLAGVVSALVAWPIILHSQKLIKALDRKKRDLTGLTIALAQSRDEAEASNRAKIAFLANMSHELRTPLNAIIGFSEIIKDGRNGPVTPPLYAEYAADIYASGRHLLDVINAVLDLSRVEAGSMRSALEPVSLHLLIGACLRELRGAIAAAGVTVENMVTTELEVVADAQLAKRVLMNTLTNAVKFNRMGGTVLIGFDIAGETATVTIADSGIGMTDDEVAAALRPFNQVDTALDRRHGGPGLGLPLAKALIEQQGGRLTIDSTPDLGTTVHLTFARAADDRHPLPPELPSR